MSSLVYASTRQPGYEWNKADETEMLGRKSFVAPTNAHQLLVMVFLADRGHKNSTRSQAIDQGRWHLRGCGGHQYPLIGSLFGPSFGAVAESAYDIAQAQLVETALGIAQQLAMPLDREYAAAKACQNRCLITGTGADLENLVPFAELELFGHQRHDIGLADRLAPTDG